MKTDALKTTFTFLFIFACHTIVFLAFWPGMCTYDLIAQIDQYTAHTFSTAHPLLHTLFIGYFHDLFKPDYNRGYAYATLIQLLIVDGAITYLVSYMRSLGTKKWLLICFVLFYAVFPINSMLAISHTKDVMFAAFAAVFFIDSLRLLKNSIKTERALFYIRMIVNAALMILFRNNAIYAVIAVFLLLTIAAIIKYKSNSSYFILRNYILVLFVCTILSVLGDRMLMKATDASTGSIKEMMSIPAQIMGRIYNEGASDQEKELILSYIPNAQEYKYYISDPMKLNLPFEIWESKCKHFLLDSAILAIHHPIISMQAVWYNIQGYIDPFHMPYSSDHFYLARYDYRGDAELVSKLPKLCDEYVKLFRTTENYDNSPIVIPFNLGIYVWICMIAFIVLMIRHLKNPKIKEFCFMAYLFPFMYLMTLLLGPAAIMRYGFLYVLLAPVSIAVLLNSKKS